MAEVGKFRAVSLEDPESLVHSGNRDMMSRDLSNLERQELIRRGASRYPSHLSVITFTSRGKKLLQNIVGQGGQEFYSGFKKVRELWHDTAVYRIYQDTAQEIQDNGGKIERVILEWASPFVNGGVASVGGPMPSIASLRWFHHRPAGTLLCDALIGPTRDVR